MKKLLWVGDAACPSGFARATHEILNVLRKTYDVTVLGINYMGDPHVHPYPIYTAAAGGDGFGVKRFIWMCDLVKPDVIILQNDGWNIPAYIQHLRLKNSEGKFAFPEHADIPVVAVVPIDGLNFQGYWLNDVTHTIFWTDFARKEARRGGYTGASSVIPLGVDLEVYHPMDRYEARLNAALPREFDDVFIVGNVNRNQTRKRWDLTVRYFANWVNSKGVDDAYLYLHVAPTGDSGPDVKQLANYYGILSRLILMVPATFYGVSEERMRETYNSFNVQVSTSQGEGFGLTTFEGMACGIQQIVPGWAALGDLLKGAASVIPCTSTAINPVAPGLNIIGGVADEKQFVEALDRAYREPEWRAAQGQAALARASEPRFRWSTIGKRYEDVLQSIVGPAVISEAEWQDLGRPQEVTAV